MILKSLDSLLEIAKSKPAAKMVLAAASDDSALSAVRDAVRAGIIIPVLVGNSEAVKEIARTIDFDLAGIEIIDEKDPIKACALSVSLIKNNKAQILMKGLVSTADLLRAVLNRENGICKGSVMSHAAMIESPHYHKVLCITDCGMNIAPDLKEKIEITNNVVDIYRRLKLDKPKVSVLAAVELINERMDATIHAAALTLMNKRGQIKDCIIDGPLAFDITISKEACAHKGITSEVGGDADIVILPNIETGNTLYKALVYLGEATIASVALGATAPIVLTSRSDSDRTKLMSIALATSMQ